MPVSNSIYKHLILDACVVYNIRCFCIIYLPEKASNIICFLIAVPRKLYEQEGSGIRVWMDYALESFDCLPFHFCPSKNAWAYYIKQGFYLSMLILTAR